MTDALAAEPAWDASGVDTGQQWIHSGRPPIVLVHGIMGSELCDAEGKAHFDWRATRVLDPLNLRQRDLSLPLWTGDGPQSDDGLVPTRILDSAALGYDVYVAVAARCSLRFLVLVLKLVLMRSLRYGELMGWARGRAGRAFSTFA